MKLDSLSLAGLGASPWVAPIRPPLSTPPARCDIVVVGAGITGLSTALALADDQLHVVVLDREFGSGATTRSGGLILGETLIGPAPAFDACEQALAEWIAHQRILCDFAWTGCLELSRSEGLPESSINWVDSGRVRVAGAVPGGVIEPVKFLNGLLGAAQRAGVRVVDDFDVQSIATGPGGLTVASRSAAVTASQVVMAVDAVSWTMRKAKPEPWGEWTLTMVLQTAPVPPDWTDAIGWGRRQPFYTRELPLLWGRALPDGSLLFGRELLPFPSSGPAGWFSALLTGAGDRLIARVRGLHPRLKDVDIQRVWAGPTARASAGVPTLIKDAELAGVLWVGGYGGHGLAQSFRLGRIAGRQLAGSAQGTLRVT